jgi:class 3 adenylate cyclase/tetratricopeptide (TPR) repeat protein
MAVTRRTVTVLFADVADSTSLGERRDPESVRAALGRWFDVARDVISSHGGTVEKFVGDAVMAVFGVPQLHEDDAVRAVRAAAELHAALDRLNEDLRRELGLEISIRVGVNTGEVVTGDGAGTLVTGDAVNVAKRLEEAAAADDVLIGETTEQLARTTGRFEDLGVLAAKGKSDPVRAWRLLSVDRKAAPFERRFDTPLVGRRRELEHLRRAYGRALAERTCHLFTLLGPAGIGKSRLACELFDDVADETAIMVGRCLPYGEGITFWPLTEALQELGSDETIQELLGDTEERELVVERLCGVTGRAQVGSQETFWAVRKVLEALARRQPLVVCFEDIHWAEPTFLDLIEYLAGWVRDAPMLLLCLARPEFLDERPSWLSGREDAGSLTLSPLSSGDSEALLDALGAPGEARAQIAEAAEGNPLYAEQMAAMVAEGGYADGLFTIPPTIQALLAARLDRLAPRERDTIERASVCGKEFWRDAIVDLAQNERDDVGAALMSLVRKELIRPHRSSARPDDAFRFAHVLIRDAAYAGIPKETRADLHERFGNWVSTTAGDRAFEFEEIVGYHFEQAYRYREQLAPVDDHARTLASRAGELLASSGHRAFARNDMPAAVNLLARGSALLADDHPSRIAALAELGSALIKTGDFTRADHVLSEALARAVAVGDKRLELRTLIEREFFRTFTNPDTPPEELIRVAESAIPLLEELGDELGLAKAWWLRSEADVIACRWQARAEALERALVHARRANDTREQSRIIALLAQALEFGPTPVDDAIRRCEELRESVPHDAAVDAAVAGALAHLYAMQGRFEEARRLDAHAQALLDKLGFHFLHAGRCLVRAAIALLAEDPTGAVDELRLGYEALGEMGERGVRSTLAAFLAHALATDGRYTEAEEFAVIGEVSGAAGDVATQAVWRIARAAARVHAGDLEAAERFARDAVDLAEATDFPELQAMAWLALSDVHRAGGHIEPAASLVERARDAYQRKGIIVAVERLSLTAKAR